MCLLRRESLYVSFSDSENATCEAEAAGLIFIIPIVQGIRVIEFTRVITTTGAATVTLKAFRTSFTGGGDFKVTATADGSMIQGITVQQ